MAGLVIDTVEIPVLDRTWRERPITPGSRKPTERNKLRSVRLGPTRYHYQGAAFFETRAAAESVRNLLLQVGSRTASGELLNRTVLVESDVGDIEAVWHLESVGNATAQWRLSFQLYEMG